MLLLGYLYYFTYGYSVWNRDSDGGGFISVLAERCLPFEKHMPTRDESCISLKYLSLINDLEDFLIDTKVPRNYIL